jgi:dipeptidyl aminopeptidase/acylaminoacyl peptidase
MMPNRIRAFIAATLAALLFSPALGRAQQTPFSLEQIMSSPFPQDLTPAPAGGSVAWVFNARGVRNIWLAQPPSYKAGAITSYAEDDGQEIGELAWTPDGRAIVYTRGGDMEMGREYPNPRSFPQGVEQAVWLIALAGGQPKRIGEGHSPAVSPKGDSVAFIYKSQVWLGRIEGSEKSVQLIHSKGESESLRWSPDGSRLAFVSRRGDHSLIGVYDFGSKAVRYLDPNVDRDFAPVWSPDSKQIAFISIPASKEAFEFGPKRAGEPWSIRVAVVATGLGHQVWIAEEGKGSVFRGIVGDSDMYWAAEGRLVFPWEKDGWTHLYSVPTSGGKAVLLTPGGYEVEDVALSPDQKDILFSSNQDDIDRRHIWRVAVSGGPPTSVTMGKGIEWSAVTTSDGHTIASQAEVRDLAPEAIPRDFPAGQLAEPQQVTFPGADGMQIHGQLFLPQNGSRHPAIVFFHGGSRRQMLLGWHYMSYYHNAYAMNQYLASRGSVVLSVNYRSGIGYGMEFREALNYGATGASEFNDVMGAGLYLRSRPDVDPRRIGLWGGSYGGYLTALGLARASDLFAAGVDLHGVHDWNLEIPNFIPAYDPTKTPDAARLAYESSPIASVKTWRSPVLLIHGDDDRNVPFSETVQLVEALRKQGVELQTLVFPDEIHDFLTYARWLEAYHAAADFFDHKLGQ